MISQYLLSQQPITVTRSKNPNFREMRLCMAADSGVRLLWPPCFANWSSARWNKRCPSKLVYLPGIPSRNNLMNVTHFEHLLFYRANNATGPTGNVPRAEKLVQVVSMGQRSRSDGKKLWAFLNFECGWIFL